jgi:hypothetical protein
MRKAFLIFLAAAVIGTVGTTHVFAKTTAERDAHIAKCQRELERQHVNMECKIKKNRRR